VHDAELETIVERINGLVQEFDSHPDPEVRERAFELLQHVDALHREGLARVAGMLRAAGHGKLLERFAEDEAVRMLLALYDLLPERARTDRAGNGRRRGFVPLDSIEIAGAPEEGEPAAEGSGSRGREETRAGDGREPGDPGTGEGWVRVDEEIALDDGEMQGLEVAGSLVLVVRLDGELHAYRDACGDGVLPLSMGRMDADVIHCPWHGCRFDAASGGRLDEPGADLEAIPVRADEAGLSLEVGSPASTSGHSPTPGRRQERDG